MEKEYKTRWSDEKLQEFFEAFQHHLKFEDEEKKQQQQIYDALFHKEDPDSNTGPGVVQLLGQINQRLSRLEATSASQKSFIGGAVFAVSCMAVFLTDSLQKLVALFKPH